MNKHFLLFRIAVDYSFPGRDNIGNSPTINIPFQINMEFYTQIDPS